MREKMKVCAVICELNPLHKGHQALFAHAKSRFGGWWRALWEFCPAESRPSWTVGPGPPGFGKRRGPGAGAAPPWLWPGRSACRGGRALARPWGAWTPCSSAARKGHPAPVAAGPALFSPAFPQALQQVEPTLPFARRRQRAAAHLVGEETAALLEKPNCILGVEYLKAILSQGDGLKAEAFPRQGAGHDVPDPQGPILSASQARELLRQGADLTGRLPQATLSLWEELRAQGKCPASLERLERAVLCKLRSMTVEDFAALPDVSEGLENRLYQAARQAGSLEEFYALVKSKRYSHARVRRLCMTAFLGVLRDAPCQPPYLRVLGMTPTGQAILRQAQPSLPLALRAADFQKLGGEALALFEQEARADDLYALSLPAPLPCGQDYTQGLIKVGF